MTVTAKEYPAKCVCTDEQLQTLKSWFEDDDRQFGVDVRGDWPPSDEKGNVYPIWYTPDDLSDTYDKLYDKNNRFNPFSGNLEPVSRDDGGVCNAPLSRWRHRYENVRFCGQYTDIPDLDYCFAHRNRGSMKKTAEEQMQTGLFAQSIDHVYEKLDPLKKLFGWGTFESLMGESSKEFGVEYEARTFDFSDANVVPPDADENDILEVRCGYPTQHTDPALSLYVAAMMGVQMMTVQPRIMYENVDDGERMMESKTVETAQLTAPPTEHDPSPQEFKTLETWSEHHLNLPLSRLVTDRPKLLERGGVDPTAEDTDDEVSNSDVVLEIDADPDDIDTSDDGTDPNYTSNQTDDHKSESEHIVEKTTDD